VEVLARGGNILYILINQRLKKFTCYKRRAKTAGRRRARRDIEAEPAPLSPSQFHASQSQAVVVVSPAPAVVVSPAAAVVVSPAPAVVVSAAAAVVVSPAAAVVVSAAAVVVSPAAVVVVSSAAAGAAVVSAAVVVSPAAAVVVSPPVVVDAGQHTSWHVGPSKTLSIKEAALREATQATKSTSGIFIFLCGFEFFLLL